MLASEWIEQSHLSMRYYVWLADTAQPRCPQMRGSAVDVMSSDGRDFIYAFSRDAIMLFH